MSWKLSGIVIQSLMFSEKKGEGEVETRNSLGTCWGHGLYVCGGSSIILT